MRAADGNAHRTTEWSDTDAAAAALVGNWKNFESFGWHGQPDDADDFCIVYTHNRDSDSLDQSNAAAIEKALEPFLGEDVFGERHSHWACGWVDGFSIRVYRNRKVTEGFKAYCSLREQLADYPVLDEEDFSRREYEEVVGLIQDIGRSKLREGAPDDWARLVFGELPNASPECVREKEVLEAMGELGLLEGPAYEVVVGNVGTVYRGPDRQKALEEYGAYVALSRAGGGGRASGQGVDLFEDDELILEHEGDVPPE